MLVLWLTTASAGFPIALPEGEDPDQWAEALSFADLEWSRRASLSVQAGSSGWVIRAVSQDGRVRVLPVERPVSAEDREAIAVLARGLARELRLDIRPEDLATLPAAPPPPPLPPPPPPAIVQPPAVVVEPPPPPAPRSPAEPREAPEPVEPEPTVPVEPEPLVPVELSPPSPTEQPVDEEPVDSAPEEVGPSLEEVAELAPVVTPTFDGPRRRWWHTRIRHPPVSLGAVGADRSGFEPAGGGFFELRALDQTVTLDLGVQVFARRWFQLPYSEVDRIENAVSLVVRPGLRVTPVLHAQVGVALERRQYQQSFADIANVMLPSVRPAIEASPFPRSWVRPFVRVGASVDLVQTVLRDESNRPTDMAVGQLLGAAGVRISSRRDPNGEVVTW